ncbi:MAG: ABC transporter substrate-binding protein [Paramuribaculum sp.]|nr:ABC transporter substrate-binding protein [Paramuribaculum sp.]
MKVVNIGISLSIAVFVLLFVESCGHNSTAIDDYNREIYVPRYASGFRILGRDTGENVLIEVFNPWQGADSVKTRLLIDRDACGVPDGFDGQVLVGDAKRIVTLSSTHIAMLDAIGETDRVVGVSGMDFITNPTIQAHRDRIGDIGYDGNINVELLMALEPDIVLLYGVNGASGIESKLRELGIPYMYVGDYVEESPLGKAEWLVPLAELTGKRSEGLKVFSSIPVRYNHLKHKVDSCNYPLKPKVMLNIPYGDSWFMPSVNNYMVRLLTDAGAEYVYTENKGNASRPVDMEEAYRLASGSDFWLNAGTVTTLSELNDVCPKFIDTPGFKNGNVYNNNARRNTAGGNDFFESAIVHPEVVLHDLVSIFHPELITDTIPLTYYHKLQ